MKSKERDCHFFVPLRSNFNYDKRKKTAVIAH